MIDINKLRRLAQAATPGPWRVNQDGLNHGFERGVLEINAQDWHALAGAWAISGEKPSEEGAANADLIAAANPAAIIELLDRLEAAEKEIALKERVIDALGSELNAVAKERDALRAKIERMDEAMESLLIRCDDSDSAMYGTLSTSFVRDTVRIARAALEESK